MMKKIFFANNDISGFILRLTAGIVMFPHGAQKMLGIFGGNGFAGTMGYFTGTMKIPAVFAFLAILTEFVGPLLLVAGFATRVAAGFMLALMLGIFITSPHLENGFFMNWSGTQAGEGIEYHLLVIGISLALVFNGGGRFSVDRFITSNRLPGA